MEARKVLVINAGSSSLKYEVIALPDTSRLLRGHVEEIADGDFGPALDRVVHEIDREGIAPLSAVGHRVVHGGPGHAHPEPITPDLIDELRRLGPLDPDHLPGSIALIEAVGRLDPGLPQVACFDTAFHHDLPRVARILPIPRRYEAAGVRRYGFHGLSFAYLMEQLARLDGEEAARGRVVLAHLGSGASLA